MYEGMFNDSQKSIRQKCHTYEQEFGDILGLLAQKDFLYFLPKH